MKYFTIKELSRSNNAANLGINNHPTPNAIDNLEMLVDNVLDPLREAWGKPIRVNSGYRCEALNRAVGGSKTSHHLKGMAADITAGSKAENKALFELVQKLRLPFTQLIDEKGFQWIHISYERFNLKMQILKL